MALPRFLYSHSESVHQKFIPESGCDCDDEPLLVSPKTNRDFTGALSKSKKEIANNPALRPSFVGNPVQESSESEEGAEDKQDAYSSTQQHQGNRREWESGTAAVAVELPEPGASAGEGSDSDEGGILEHMGEERRPSKKKKKEGNGVVVGGEGRAINDGDDDYIICGDSELSRDPDCMYVFYKDDETRTKWEVS
jgi:hypothetical protein